MLHKLNMLCFLKYVSYLEFSSIGQIYIHREIIFMCVERNPREREERERFSERDGPIESSGIME
jgi:hypothetical protein